jgi:WD40 repeat protein
MTLHTIFMASAWPPAHRIAPSRFGSFLMPVLGKSLPIGLVCTGLCFSNTRTTSLTESLLLVVGGSGHNGSVWKVTWGHPEYGQVLASCSFDTSVCVWEEKAPNQWDKRATLVDARKSVVDIKFAPKHQGLRLVCLSIHHHHYNNNNDDDDRSYCAP